MLALGPPVCHAGRVKSRPLPVPTARAATGPRPGKALGPDLDFGSSFAEPMREEGSSEPGARGAGVPAPAHRVSVQTSNVQTDALVWGRMQ